MHREQPGCSSDCWKQAELPQDRVYFVILFYSLAETTQAREMPCLFPPWDKHPQSVGRAERVGGRAKRKGGRQNKCREIKRRRWKQISEFEQELPFLDTFLPSLTELCFLVALWELAACGTQVRCTGSPAADIRIAVMPTAGTRSTCRKETTGRHIKKKLQSFKLKKKIKTKQNPSP